MLERQQRPAIRLKSPREAFPKCPSCLSSRVAPLGDSEEEVYCRDCDWNSVAIHAELMAEAGIWPKVPASVLRARRAGAGDAAALELYELSRTPAVTQAPA